MLFVTFITLSTFYRASAWTASICFLSVLFYDTKNCGSWEDRKCEHGKRKERKVDYASRENGNTNIIKYAFIENANTETEV